MGDSTSQDLVLLMPEKSEEIIIKPKTKVHVTEERSRWNFESRGRFLRTQSRSTSVLSSEPSNSEMTEMQEFSEETEKRFPSIQNISISILSSEHSSSEMNEMQEFLEETEVVQGGQTSTINFDNPLALVYYSGLSF